MQLWWFIAVNVSVAAFVGGLTNFFAIKMLFHPRRALYVLGRRIPFTPGLIPKRKDDIASSLGEVVANYLVTAEGLREWLRGESMQEKAALRIRDWLLARAAGGNWTPGSVIRMAMDDAEWEDKRGKLAEEGEALVVRWIGRMWEEGGWKAKTIAELVPGWSEEAVAGWAADIEARLTESLRGELLSERGQQALRGMISGLLDRTGGWLGVLAGIFVDEEKAAQRLTEFLVEQLSGGTLRDTVRAFIAGQLQAAGQWTLEQAAARLSGEDDPLPWLQERALGMLRLEGRIRQLETFDLGGWLIRNEPLWMAAVRRGVGMAFDLLDRRLESIVAAVELPNIVRRQVEKFPVERVERIILSVSGREFRAITWLGALLGGMIGLFQSLFLLIAW